MSTPKLRSGAEPTRQRASVRTPVSAAGRCGLPRRLRRSWCLAALLLTFTVGAAAAAAPTVLVTPLAGVAASSEIAILERDLDRTATAMLPRLPLSLEAPIRVALEPDYVQQIVHTGAVGEAVPASSTGYDLHLVLTPEDGDAYRYQLGRRLVVRTGLALPPWLERGAALWLAGGWYGRPWRDWLPDLVAAEVLPSADELLASELQRDGSEVLWAPVAAAVIDVLPGETLRAKLGRGVEGAAVARALAKLASARAPTAPPVPTSLVVAEFRGVSFAMLNRPDQGYHAPSIEGQLARLRALGTNSVSIMPFAFMRQPDAPGLGFIHWRPSGETDIGCLHAARRAHAQGLSVLWKPQVWVGHSSWPGEVAMTDEAAWAAWWRSYRRFIVHHAVLARFARAEVLSLGVELDRTLGRGTDWRQLIDAVRRIYPGALTYASNWYGGLEAVPFWDRLDLVGVDAYFPLAAGEEASAAELAAGAQRVAERLAALARSTGRRVLLTEVGFAARRAAWQSPHEEGGTFSGEDQARSYRALFAALAGQPWLAGVYVWKAMSAEVGPRPGDADFLFLGRPAEEEVRRFFAR